MPEAYEKAIIKYYSKLSIVPVPIMYWDIFVSYNQEIVFATQGIHGMNSYHAFELIGKSPKIFQGELIS